MSWQLAAFTILALALAGGFAWYERARPDARIIALVATLAAFAALGRIAFAALPNVKPTTDIVLVSGYALGGGPGFAVGALAGLTSNFFFGQGPWTPWQMAAWGVTGVIGAGLARATGGRIGRWPLALICGVVGYVFAAVQDVGDWVTYSDHSVAQLGVYVGKGTGFDFVHAAGCVGFALAFGPALMRSIQRFGRRLQVVWQPAGGLGVMVLVLCSLGCLAGTAGQGTGTQASAAGTPTGYLLAAQHRDGGFGSSPGAPSSQLYTGWVALGLASERRNPQNVRRGGRSVIDYVRAGVSRSMDPGSLERTILAVRAAGVSARRFGGHDLVAWLERDIRSDGSVADQVNWTAFAVLALRAAGVPSPSRSLAWLVRQQDRDGGFNFATAGGGSDVDDTGAALEALAGVPGASSARSRAVSFIRRQQNRDGGLPSQPGGESNAQSTAWGVQGLLAVGVDPSSLHRRGAGSPLGFLQSLTGSDGHVHYSRTSDQTPVWVTAQAVMALARKPLPLAPLSTGGSRHHAAHGPGARTAAQRSGDGRTAHRGRTSPTPDATPAKLLDYATDAGVATALALAPVGLN